MECDSKSTERQMSESCKSICQTSTYFPNSLSELGMSRFHPHSGPPQMGSTERFNIRSNNFDRDGSNEVDGLILSFSNLNNRLFEAKNKTKTTIGRFEKLSQTLLLERTKFWTFEKILLFQKMITGVRTPFKMTTLFHFVWYSNWLCSVLAEILFLETFTKNYPRDFGYMDNWESSSAEFEMTTDEYAIYELKKNFILNFQNYKNFMVAGKGHHNLEKKFFQNLMELSLKMFSSIEHGEIEEGEVLTNSQRCDRYLNESRGDDWLVNMDYIYAIIYQTCSKCLGLLSDKHDFYFEPLTSLITKVDKYPFDFEWLYSIAHFTDSSLILTDPVIFDEHEYQNIDFTKMTFETKNIFSNDDLKNVLEKTVESALKLLSIRKEILFLVSPKFSLVFLDNTSKIHDPVISEMRTITYGSHYNHVMKKTKQLVWELAVSANYLKIEKNNRVPSINSDPTTIQWSSLSMITFGDFINVLAFLKYLEKVQYLVNEWLSTHTLKKIHD